MAKSRDKDRDSAVYLNVLKASPSSVRDVEIGGAQKGRGIIPVVLYFEQIFFVNYTK